MKKYIVMDNIWDRTSFEVVGHWPLWRGKNEWPRGTEKSRTLNNNTWY